MDIVVPLGQGTLWQHNEIRYALRSIDKFCTDGYDNIFIVGEKPKFFEYGKRVFHIDYKPDPRDAKELRIWRKIKRACEEEMISEEFFFMNDDYFFLKEFSMINFPYYHKGDLRDFDWASLPIKNIKSGYSRKSKRTLDVLEDRGYSTFHFDIHCPNIVNKRRFLQCWNELNKEILLEAKSPNGSLLINTTYLNYLGVDGEFMKDVKLGKIEELKNYDEPLLFSISDKAVNKDLKLFMQETYPNKLSFEKSVEQDIEQQVMPNDKVLVHITSRFIERGQQFGPGKWKLEKNFAGQLVASGKAYFNKDEKPKAALKYVSEVVQKPKETITELPEDFPFREKLVSSGFGTIESLRVKDVEEQLQKIPGLGKASITKIGMALGE